MTGRGDAFDCDVAVIGSGFGGAVSALRLAEKGYDVLVLEQGRKVSPSDIEKARTSLRHHLWEPDLGMSGFFWQRVFRDVGIIGGAGVGGGSIVWGGVLLEPEPRVFDDPAWGGGESDWREAMKPFYEEAARMLGRTPNPYLGEMDEFLRQTAAEIGGEDTFGPVPVAIYFGEEGVEAEDPFFGGEGPARTGCRLCGGCLSGCPYGSKNTLDLNYLYLAERKGVRIVPEHRVDSIAPLGGEGYELKLSHPWKRSVRRSPVRARQVVLAAGVLGSLELLFRCRDELGTLPGISPKLGERVRTNSEAVSIVLAGAEDADLTRGPAISSDFHPDPRTHVTQNRYVGGAKFLRPQIGPLVDGEVPGRRALATLAAIFRKPGPWLKAVSARSFERRLTALTVMQDVDSELKFEFGRSPLAPWKRVLRSRAVPGRRAPSYLPVANEAARAFARASDGEPHNLLVESAGGRSFTAHILGGAAIGEDAAEGVIDSGHEVHGHPGLFVVDASAIPVNLGVNPSLTITAMAERFASLRPARAERDGDPEGAGEETPAASDPGPAHRPASSLPASPARIRRIWGALPAPEPGELAGSHRAVFVGPPPMRTVAPGALGLAGLPDWFGKRFDLTGKGDELAGMNLLRSDGQLVEYLEMTARVEASVIDGAPVLVSTYGPAAPLPWRHVRDEFRRLGPGTLLGMAVVDLPLLRGVGMAFALEAAESGSAPSAAPGGSQL